MNQLFLDTLKEQYDRNKFKRFILEFFNQIDLAEKNIAVESQFSKHIDSLFFLGQYEDQFKKKVHILEVRLKTESKLEQARTMQRNLIAKYLKDHWIDGALVAFYTSNSTSWRLSLVKVDYKFDDNGKTKEELSPAKRYSFLVGKDEPTHTAQNQLLKIFEQTTQNPSLGQIEEAFSVEKVTKEFFEEYRNLFEGLVVELKRNHTFINEATKNNINTDNFAKKLLGQIVFLYFLQKKGWLGVPKGKSWGEGDRNFLRSLFTKSIEDKKNFFNNYLEKLFYDTLNNPRSDRVDRNYSEYFQSKIPFLNGGLFEPQYDWENSLMYLDNSIFEQIFDVFDRYNFTVKEDEPLEKEVAVDPEMLGKVFENLLEENLRKGKGTYYTPREIVHYMCQESLINYLIAETKIEENQIRKLAKHYEIEPLDIEDFELYKSDKRQALDKASVKPVTYWKEDAEKLITALKNIRIVDPACGSGAFLVGMLQEIMQLRKLLEEKVSEYDLKKETIQNCIYGVDIDPGAIEIAKLRLWLSLVVDYDLEEIEPLPNLDYKLMVGNSLIEKLDSQVSAKTNDSERSKLIDQLRELKDRYFTLSSSQEKKELRKQVNELILLIENYDNEKKKQSILDNILARNRQVKLFDIGIEQQTLADIPSQIKQLDTLKDVKETDHFEWHLNFNEVFEKGGFNIVIANPPYVRISGINELEDQLIRNTFITVFGNYDLYIPFIEKGIDLLKEDGTLAYITPNKYLTKRYANKLRPFLLETTSLCELVDTSQAKTFDSASVYPVITILSKNQIKQKTKIVILNDKTFQTYFQDPLSADIYYIDQDNFKTNDNFSFDIFVNTEVRKLFNKFHLNTKPLGEYSKILTGTPAIDKFYGWKKLLISENEIRSTNKPSRKFINVSNIKSYFIEWGKEIRAVGKRIKKPYLVFDEKLVGENKWAVFEKKKIVIKGTALKLTAAYDDVGFANLSLYAVIFNENHNDYNNTLFHLGLLNSKLLNFWYTKKFATSNISGNYISFNGIYLAQLPIKIEAKEEKILIIGLVDKILAITKDEDYLQNQYKQSKVKVYEKQIDQLVFKIYDLTLEEIAIVES